MKEIAPIQLWQNGQNKTATHLGLTLVHDNLQDTAVFSYRLCSYIGQGEDQTLDVIATGAVTIEGQEYEDWGVNLPANEEAYIIACQKLNLSLVSN
jgi:hypothetical protein